MANTKKIPKLLVTSLACHTTLKTVDGCKTLDQIMDKLTEETYLGNTNNGYIKAKISPKSCNEIWALYEALYSSIRNAKYEFSGEITDFIDIKLAKKDKKFQSFMKAITQN